MKRLSLIPLTFLFIFISCKNQKQVEPAIDLLDIENGLLPAIQVKGEALKTFNILERMDLYNVPGLSLALVEDEIRFEGENDSLSLLFNNRYRLYRVEK